MIDPGITVYHCYLHRYYLIHPIKCELSQVFRKPRYEKSLILTNLIFLEDRANFHISFVSYKTRDIEKVVAVISSRPDTLSFPRMAHNLT